MPRRVVPLVTDRYYHVFNRGIDGKVTFSCDRELKRALLCMWYYRHVNAPVKLSLYLGMDPYYQQVVARGFVGSQTRVEILAYCLMGNHYHLLLKQLQDGGISWYMSQFQNSYTRYFNTRNDRSGPLFMTQFKAVRVDTDEQLVHVSRYIHLNPYTGRMVNSLDDIWEYPWSSMREYLGVVMGRMISSPVEMMSHFKNPLDYKQFVEDQAGYQRDLKKLEHLLTSMS